MTTFVQTEVRASEIARGCNRMSVLRALGHEPVQHDTETLEFFSRGSLFEEYVVRQLIAKHGRDNVRRQVEIQHPLGTGHADALIIPERLLVEIKSTTAGTLTTPVFENGVNQLRFYLRFCDEADEGALMMINPSTLKPVEVFTVRLTVDDIAEIDAQLAEIQAAIEAQELPPRVCTKPGQARGMMCSFGEVCFQDWEPPPTRSLDDPVAIDLAERIAALSKGEHPHKDSIKTLKAARDEAQDELSEYIDYGETQVGQYLVKRWRVNGKRSVSVKALEAAGFDASPFATTGEGHDRFEVRLADAPVAGEVDYGDVPFD